LHSRRDILREILKTGINSRETKTESPAVELPR
jgi:hypothetical protein